MKDIINVKANTARNVADVLKASQLFVALTILGLTAHLVNRYQRLVDECGSSESQSCDYETFLLGAFKYCTVPPILAICDTIVWVVDSYLAGLPYTFVIWCAWIVQGFYMGGATTLAARINGEWNCQNPEGRGAVTRLCDEFFADVSLMWVALLNSWILIVFLYKLSSYYPRGMTTDAMDHQR